MKKIHPVIMAIAAFLIWLVFFRNDSDGNKLSIDKQVDMAFFLAERSVKDLTELQSRYGDFSTKPEVETWAGQYVETSTITYADSGKKVLLDYKFGQLASEEISGEHVQIIGKVANGSLSWSCDTEEEKISDHFPEFCR